ncbi:hypothetical protein BCON_0266g00050 [Botryotinia convoluta]|uniref:Helicase C-terminal domain-containing protein n=1 Tax=Botryotinia convoluta TaxID=54673 RepID=A0A4Z1HLT6_9HELO|nr:hypothetical protein BCON_0266g00050 [Botryotinia convoluta]
MEEALTMEQVIKSITEITFNPQNQLRAADINAAAASFLKDIRPGRGLKGNVDEEEYFHKGKNRTISEGLAATINEEYSGESTGELSDGGISDIDNVDVGDRPYKPSNTIPDTAEEEFCEELLLEDEDEDEDEANDDTDVRDKLGDKYITVNDEQVGVWDYFGKSHLQHIYELYHIAPIQHPQHMNYQLWDYQLKMIAQSLFVLNGPFRGFLNGSEMGLGKTMEAIVTMWMYREEAGVCVVVCPAAVCRQWVKTVNTAWKEGHGMKAYHLNDANMSAHELQSLGYDVVVMSYNFLEMNARKMKKFPGELALYANNSTAPKPKRPTSAMHTELWRDLCLEPKLLVLDEAQLINKPALSWAKAVARVNAKRTLMLSGTLPRNTWTNIYGYMKLLKGHPFATPGEFLRIFGVPNERNTTRSKLRCLSRFLQGVTIAHPASILRLPGIKIFRISFKLNPKEAWSVSERVQEYKKSNIGSKDHIIDGGDSKEIGLFTYAVQAQVKSAHPMLGEELDARIERLEDAKFRMFSGEDVEEIDYADRHQWLDRVKRRAHLMKESGRVEKIIQLYIYLVSTYPGRKIVIFSCFLKFLDILDEALYQECSIKSSRYDGSIAAEQRIEIENSFRQADPKLPLLITGGSGGVGLNIAYAGIVIQAEPWWNSNTEKQAADRTYRQGQTQEVLVFRMYGVNSEIDAEVVSVANRKVSVNRDLMKVLITTHTEEPKIEELLVYPPVPAVEFPETEKVKGNKRG